MKNFCLRKAVYVFDWDGTVLDSMAIKFDNFSRVLADCINKKAARTVSKEDIKLIYKKNSGMPRRFIFDTVMHELNCAQAVTFEEFTEKLSIKNKNDLQTARVFDDTASLLERLSRLNLAFGISSSAPEAELREIVDNAVAKNKLPEPDFVLGTRDGFGKGIEHLTDIANKFDNLAFSEMVFFGDEIKDYELVSKVEGVEIFIIDREHRYHDHDFTALTSMRQIVPSND